MQYRLTHLSGGNLNHIDIVESTPIVLGRDEACHVRLHREKDLVVSSTHAQIDVAENGGFQIANLSRNGTLVNGVVVEEAAPLPNHATIQLGRDGPRLRFDVDEETHGISFAEVKRKTGKIKRQLEKAPDTEERPIVQLSEIETPVPAADDSAKRIAAAVLVAIAILAVILGVVLSK